MISNIHFFDMQHFFRLAKALQVEPRFNEMIVGEMSVNHDWQLKRITFFSLQNPPKDYEIFVL